MAQNRELRSEEINMKDPVAGAIKTAVLLVAGLTVVTPAACSQSADTILVNGKILTVDKQFSAREALAIREGKIMATGSSADVKKLAGPGTRVIDLQGRTVIPGMIDNHMHATRAAETFSPEGNWTGARSLGRGAGRLNPAARKTTP